MDYFKKLLNAPPAQHFEQSSPQEYASPIESARTNKDDLNRFLVHLNVTNYNNLKDNKVMSSVDQQQIVKMLKNVEKAFGKETYKIGLLSATNTYSSKYSAFAEELAPLITISDAQFTGGLDVGDRCRFMSTSTSEIIIHDAQHLKSDFIRKHIGNDDIHIVFDEGKVPITPWTTGGDFGDVIVVVRPLTKSYFVTIYKKINTPSFGPMEGTMKLPMEGFGKLLMSSIFNGLFQLNAKTWIDSKQDKLYPLKNKETCIQYYREKYMASDMEELAGGLAMSTWQ